MLSNKTAGKKEASPSSTLSPAIVRITMMGSNKLYRFPIIIADKKGFFKKYNLEPNLQVVDKSPSSLLLTNKADILLAPPTTVLQANTEGTKFITVGNVMNNSENITVSSKDPKNIKTVAVLGPLAKQMTTGLLKKLGVSEKDINFQEMKGIDIAFAALVGKKVDALGYIPQSDWMLYKEKNQLSDSDYKIIAETQSDESLNIPVTINVLNDYLNKDEKTLVQFSKSIIEANSWLLSNRDESIKILSSEFSLPEKETSIYVDSYISVTKNLTFTPSVEKIKYILSLIEASNPEAKKYPADSFVSTKISDELSKSGFLSKFNVK